VLDFSWSELLVVVIVTILAVGPKQLPEVLYGFGRLIRRLQYMKYALSKQFDDFMDQADLRDIRNPIKMVPSDFLGNLDEEAEEEAEKDQERKKQKEELGEKKHDS
jgi:sec-independent protein translocase protein TatB